MGGPLDNSQAGAAWMFTRSDGVWTQQGNKLVGSGAEAHPPSRASPSRCRLTATPPSWAGRATTRMPGRRGCSAAATGSGPSEATSSSASGASANAQQGQSVALSADGKTAVLGGPFDSALGAAWPFAQPEVPFASFTAKLTISSYKPGFALTSHFTLGAGSSGINPLYEAVTLAINSFTMTIPPFSFRWSGLLRLQRDHLRPHREGVDHAGQRERLHLAGLGRPQSEQDQGPGDGDAHHRHRHRHDHDAVLIHSRP